MQFYDVIYLVNILIELATFGMSRALPKNLEFL